MRRRFRFTPARAFTVLLAVTLMTAGAEAPARAALTTKDKGLYHQTGIPVPQLLYDKYGNSIPGPTCRSYPGVTMDGDVLARAYIGTDSYVKLYLTFKTHYDQPVAIAKNARSDFSCLQLSQFEKYSDTYGPNLAPIKALADSACATPNAAAANLWCRFAQWELDPAIGGVKDKDHTVYDSLNLGLNDLCRQPEFVRDPNTGQPYVPTRKTADGLPVYRGPASFADWADPGVTVQHENLEGELGSAELSGINTAATVAGFGIAVYNLLNGMPWQQFADTIAVAGGLGAGLSEWSWIGSVVQLVVLQILGAVIDHDAEVKIGDFTLAGGAAAIDPGAQRPDNSGRYGTYVGYGKVQNLSASNDYANWLNQQAVALYQSKPNGYPNPNGTPADAIAMQKIIAKKIASPKDPLHAAARNKRGSYCVNNTVPWMSNVMENWSGAPASVTQIALDTMLRQWIHSMVGGDPTDHNFICTAAQRAAMTVAARRSVVHAGADDPTNPLNDPWLRAGLECRVGTLGQLISSTWIPRGTDERAQPNFCMNRYPSITKVNGQWRFYKPDLWAMFTNKDFHCGEDEHFRSLFSMLQGFL